MVNAVDDRAAQGRVLVVYTHPLEDSLVAAVRDRVMAGLRAAGREAVLVDLYGEDFDPLVTASDRDGEESTADRTHDGSGSTTEPVARYRRLVRSADTLVFVHPTWWGGTPAMLKGWIERVLGGAGPGSRGVEPLRHVRRVVVVTTHGSPRWQNVLEGQAGRRLFLRGLRTVVHPLARARWIAFYGVDRSTPADRAAFLRRVERRLARL